MLNSYNELMGCGRFIVEYAVCAGERSFLPWPVVRWWLALLEPSLLVGELNFGLSVSLAC